MLHLFNDSDRGSQVIGPDVMAIYNSSKENLSRQTKLLDKTKCFSSMDKVHSNGWHMLQPQDCPDIARTG